MVARFSAFRKSWVRATCCSRRSYHDNGPWKHPDNYYQFNGLSRTARAGRPKVTASHPGQIMDLALKRSDRRNAMPLAGFFGTLDPTDGGNSQRYSLQAEWHRQGANSSQKSRPTGSLRSGFILRLYLLPYGSRSRRSVEQQAGVGGGAGCAPHHLQPMVWPQRRKYVRLAGPQRLGPQRPVSDGRSRARGQDGCRHRHDSARDHARGSLYGHPNRGICGEQILWGEKFRTVAALRGDVGYVDLTSLVTPANSGTANKFLPSPKLSLIFGPWARTEFYIQGGFGFHSNDARGATQTVEPISADYPYPNTTVSRIPLLIPTKGAEVGVRTTAIPHLQSTISLWYLRSASELQQDGDTGGTVASTSPSNRYGVEWANYYTPVEHLTFDFDLADSWARFTELDEDDAAPGSPGGKRVPEAVGWVVSSGVTDHLSQHFSASLRLRYLARAI